MKKLSSIISSIIGFIGICSASLAFLLLHGSYGPYWKGIFFCILICIICFGYIWLSEKKRRNKLSPEDRAIEDEEKRKMEKIIEKASYSSFLNNSWIVQQAKEDYSNSVNDFIYKKMDEMIEEAEDPDTKIMLLKKKNKMLSEDLKKQKGSKSQGPQ